MIDPTNKPQQQINIGQLSPFDKINDQIRHLDRSLNTIDGWSDESDLTRTFIVGQIESLKWALKQFDVG